MPIITQDNNAWILETAQTAYAIGINARGQLVTRYWGKKLHAPTDYPPAFSWGEYASFNGAGQRDPEEYPTYGDLKYTEPCLKVTFEDGTRDLWLAYQRAFLATEDNALIIVLYDTHYQVRVYLTYRIHEEHDLIERYVEIQNKENAPLTIERIFSAQWHLPMGQPYHLTHFTGKWNDEWHKHIDPLSEGVKVLESRRITSSHHHNPSFMIAPHSTTEGQGECWFGVLEWSGNWKLTAEVTDFGTTRLSMGLNDWDFAMTLHSGENYVTPSVFLGYTPNGYSASSHLLHAFLRGRLPHPTQIRQVLYNSWEATLFAVDEASQKRYAEIASSLGVELFVMDDGWFKGRNSDSAGLGDWTPDPQKFPNGLTPLIDHVNALGMVFGLWLEPEMVNPDSDLYRAHPDWVLHFSTRERTTARNQLILNLAREDVQNYLIAQIDALLSAYNIAFIKWDMNRNATEAGWQEAQELGRNPKEVWVRYVEGVYRVWGTLRQKHPHVIWQSCSGGGGRTDVGILNFADQVWVSDNTDPTRRLPMQSHFLHIYPPNTMESWVTDMGESYLPLKFRFHVSMAGVLGIGANITHWTPAQQEEAKQLISDYKRVRHVIQFGKVYRLPQQGAYSALQYVSQDQKESVVFIYRTYSPNPTLPYALTLRGLDSAVPYTSNAVSVKSGQAWMNVPHFVTLENFGSLMIELAQAPINDEE